MIVRRAVEGVSAALLGTALALGALMHFQEVDAEELQEQLAYVTGATDEESTAAPPLESVDAEEDDEGARFLAANAMTWGVVTWRSGLQGMYAAAAGASRRRERSVDLGWRRRLVEALHQVAPPEPPAPPMVVVPEPHAQKRTVNDNAVEAARPAQESAPSCRCCVGDYHRCDGACTLAAAAKI